MTPRKKLTSIELFGGCGGLGLGLAQAGFHSVEFWEWDDDAVATVRCNAASGVEHVRDWTICHGDVRIANWEPKRGNLALISGGPPCQAFAIGGKKRGHHDPRDMWPEAIRAIREARPDAFLFENVRNLSGPRFSGYLDWIEHSLRHASEPRGAREAHFDHLARLRRLPTTEYGTSVSVVNAADFGAPQERKRILVAGIRADLIVVPGHPEPTHSKDRLLWDQWVTGEYWQRHDLPRPSDESIPRPHGGAVARLRAKPNLPENSPWLTLRDAVADLGVPNGFNHHLLQDGARSYAGHTGSPLDWPAKALKAGDHGVPGGENTIRFEDGTVRYLTLREAARLVGLPDDFIFPVSWTESMRQLGNAVPAQLASAAGSWIRNLLESQSALSGPRSRQAA